MSANRTRRRGGATCRSATPTIKPNEKLVTYVARDLEPYRGFHVMMRAVPHLLRARKDVRVVMVGGDGISYGVPPPEGTWRQKMLAELGDGIDPERVLFPGRLDYKTYVAMLQRSDAHVYLSYPFVASWSLREALATGCVVIGSDTPTVSEFVDARTERTAGAVLRSEGTGGYGAAGAGGCAARAPAARECAAVRREEPGDDGLPRRLRGADRATGCIRAGEPRGVHSSAASRAA